MGGWWVGGTESSVCNIGKVVLEIGKSFKFIFISVPILLKTLYQNFWSGHASLGTM